MPLAATIIVIGVVRFLLQEISYGLSFSFFINSIIKTVAIISIYLIGACTGKYYYNKEVLSQQYKFKEFNLEDVNLRDFSDKIQSRTDMDIFMVYTLIIAGVCFLFSSRISYCSFGLFCLWISFNDNHKTDFKEKKKLIKKYRSQAWNL